MATCTTKHAKMVPHVVEPAVLNIMDEATTQLFVKQSWRGCHSNSSVWADEEVCLHLVTDARMCNIARLPKRSYRNNIFYFKPNFAKCNDSVLYEHVIFLFCLVVWLSTRCHSCSSVTVTMFMGGKNGVKSQSMSILHCRKRAPNDVMYRENTVFCFLYDIFLSRDKIWF